MYLTIEPQLTIHDLQEMFGKEYPFLKIEFFKEGHEMMQLSPADSLIRHDKTIGELKGKNVPGQIDISGKVKTGALEQLFKNMFGLNVQVYRQQGNTWIQTAGTDYLSLEEQNRIAKEKTIAMAQPHYQEPMQDIEY